MSVAQPSSPGCVPSSVFSFGVGRGALCLRGALRDGPGTYVGFDCMRWLSGSRALDGQMWDYSKPLDYNGIAKAMCLAII